MWPRASYQHTDSRSCRGIAPVIAPCKPSTALLHQEGKTDSRYIIIRAPILVISNDNIYFLTRIEAVWPLWQWQTCQWWRIGSCPGRPIWHKKLVRTSIYLSGRKRMIAGAPNKPVQGFDDFNTLFYCRVNPDFKLEHGTSFRAVIYKPNK